MTGEDDRSREPMTPQVQNGFFYRISFPRDGWVVSPIRSSVCRDVLGEDDGVRFTRELSKLDWKHSKVRDTGVFGGRWTDRPTLPILRTLQDGSESGVLHQLFVTPTTEDDGGDNGSSSVRSVGGPRCPSRGFQVVY